MKYDKLVRDFIPETIERSGKKAVTRILNDDEFKVYLEKKLDEEAKEFHESKSIEELADILEVVYYLCRAYGYTVAQLKVAVDAKCRIRGGFDRKILLQEVCETEGEIDK